MDDRAKQIATTATGGGLVMGGAGMLYAASAWADAVEGASPSLADIREGGAVVILALLLYLVVLKLIPGFLAVIQQQSTANAAALSALTEAINKQTVSIVSELRHAQGRPPEGDTISGR